MSIPGINLLSDALQVINKQNFVYYANSGRSINSSGILVPVFSDGVTLSGSVQPISSKEKNQMGLNLKDVYIKVYASLDFLDYNRGVSGDELSYGGDRFKVVSADNWYGQDGWKKIIAMKID